MSDNKTAKILIVAPAWLGDLIMSQALLKLIKARNPSATIDVLAAPYLHPIIQRMPEVHQVLALPFKHGEFNLLKRIRLGKSLRTANYDQAFILPNSFKSALIPFFAKIKLRAGWRGEMRYGLLNKLRILDKKKLPRMVEQYLALGLAKNEPLPADIEPFYPEFILDTQNITATLTKFNLDKNKLAQPVLAFCYGGEYGSSKRWPPKYFAEVAKIQKPKGWQIWLFGGKKDQPLANEIQTLSHNACLDFTGKTSLSEVLDLLAQVSLVLTNDTGLMHMAAALKKPLLVIYGSTSPDFTPPLSKQAKIIKLDLPCSPCFERVCPLKHFKCMLDLTPAKIIAAIDAMPSTDNPRVVPTSGLKII